MMLLLQKDEELITWNEMHRKEVKIVQKLRRRS